MWLKNKKGDISITLLVVMILVLCASSLLIFLMTQSSYERDMSQIMVVPYTYSAERAFEFFLHSLAVEIVENDPAITPQSFLKELR